MYSCTPAETGRRQVRLACGAHLKTHTQWPLVEAFLCPLSSVLLLGPCPYNASYGGGILIPPLGRPLVYISFLLFLLFPGDVLGLSGHLSERILRRERSAYEELTSLTGSSLTQAGLCTAGSSVSTAYSGGTGHLADQQCLLLLKVRSEPNFLPTFTEKFTCQMD